MVAALPIAGLVASSSAQRLKPHAIDIRVNIDPVHWFLSPPRDTRSSLYLEDAATEFQVQGLELDWTKSHVGRRLTLEWERLELSQFSRGEVDRREEARAAAVSEERLPRVAHAGPAGDGDLRAAGGEAGPDAESRLLRGRVRLPDGHGRGRGLGRLVFDCPGHLADEDAPEIEFVARIVDVVVFEKSCVPFSWSAIHLRRWSLCMTPQTSCKAAS